MAAVTLRSEERIGLGVAVALHAALVAFLLWRPVSPPLTPPDRIEVSISDEVGLTSTSPEPKAQAAPDVAPELGEPPQEAAPPEPEPEPAPRPEPPQPRPEPPKAEPPKPAPRPVASPRPVARATPRPVPRPTMRPELPRPVARPTLRPSARPAPPARPAARPSAASSPQSSTRPAGATRIGDDFLKGVQGARATGASRNPPAATIGPAVRSALLGALSRELKPHWQGKVPEGADSEKLVTKLRWRLNRDGTLAGTPQLVSQNGITDANRPQAPRHAEQAIRAVQLAAPFDLPAEYYDAWKVVTIDFDKRLAQ